MRAAIDIYLERYIWIHIVMKNVDKTVDLYFRTNLLS